MVAINFKDILLQWYTLNKRDLPWRKTTDPYKIWISEIIFQQTRIEQGKAYYERFIAAFPTI
ncbi:MAG TPA: A/G-specific adenine glycosylase, partial [Bacteroidales bacterium]|nr:A/G-specific adenine glycosylase [Bacteroidales bacterium]HPT04834.1 A/G-specific adenine glycosylase [Bacteroidales bacterium]